MNRKKCLDIFMIMVIISFFEVYSFIFISKFPVTPVVVTICLIWVLKIFRFGKTCIEKNVVNIIAILIIIISGLSFIMKIDSNANSFLLVLMFFVTFIFSFKEYKEEQFNYFIDIFCNIVFILAIYGVYQFFARLYNLPFSDLLITDHMVEGFNWTNSVIVGGKMFFRSNAIFREPSIFSRTCSLAFIFTLNKMINKSSMVKFHNIIKLIVYVIAIIFTFSGACFLELIILGTYIFYVNRKKASKLIITVTLITFIVAISSFYINYEIIMTYFYTRINEFGTSGMSASLRYVAPYKLLFRSFLVNPFVGFGIGAKEVVIDKLASGIIISKGVDSTFARIGMEIGLIGLILFCMFLVKIYRKENSKNINYNILFLFVIIECFNGEMFLSTMFWPYIYILNSKIIKASS